MLRIYGKKKNAKRFKAYSNTAGALVTNLIYADIYEDTQRDDLDQYVAELHDLNPDYLFKIKQFSM